MPRKVASVSDMAGELLACLCAQLAGTPAGPVCWCCVRHADTVPTADACACECDLPGGAHANGEAWVRVQQVVGTPVANRECERGRYMVTFELGSRRCVTTDSDLTCQELSDEAAWLAADGAAARRAVRCCPVLADRTLGQVLQVPTGPLGGCAGWVTTVAVQVSECAC